MSTQVVGSFDRHQRTRARRSAVQALYQWDLSASPMEDIIDEFFNSEIKLKKIDKKYFKKILLGVVKESENLDQQLTPLIDRKLHDLDPIERAILRLGMYELIFQIELPYKVILNEAIELAKRFGADQSYKYINGVLDKAQRSIERQK